MPSEGNDTTDIDKSNFHISPDYQKAYDKWKKEVLTPSLEKNPERLKEFIKTSSQKVDRLYTNLDTKHIDFKNYISNPG